ncbi:butyrophilin-like protein 2 [Solea solea]|uniref:butyrophilin-like protein 2 n=1 Tax=Solea solea TaxID=90069 RepID=UPI00272CA949|nr:butyrophilin-like protein 2 [Solea solea]
MRAVVLWCSGLLLSFLTVCVCLERDCVLGVVGRPVSLPCSLSPPPTLANVTIEWRRDEDVVLRSEWTQDGGQVDGWSVNGASIVTEAALTGNMSLQLDTVQPSEDTEYYGLFMVSGENHTSLCSVCLRAAASFSLPLLQREEAEQGDETAFLCHSSGGFPEPSVYWLINNTEEPPGGSVFTLAASLPDSPLYNVTSHLKVNISKDANVSCAIENPTMNQTLTSTSYGVKADTVIGRASQAMWIFSTALCVVVGVMVIVGVAYQINLDRVSKRKKKEYHQYMSRRPKRRPSCEEETKAMKPRSRETDV